MDRTYPKGKLSGDDDGSTPVAIAADKRNERVIINFFKPVEWIGLDKDSGFELLKSLAEKLTEISDLQINVSVEIKN